MYPSALMPANDIGMPIVHVATPDVVGGLHAQLYTSRMVLQTRLWRDMIRTL